MDNYWYAFNRQSIIFEKIFIYFTNNPIIIMKKQRKHRRALLSISTYFTYVETETITRQLSLGLAVTLVAQEVSEAQVAQGVSEERVAREASEPQVVRAVWGVAVLQP